VVTRKIAKTNGEHRHVETERKRQNFANQRLARIVEKPAESARK
jgi:hypothetical protein